MTLCDKLSMDLSLIEVIVDVRQLGRGIILATIKTDD